MKDADDTFQRQLYNTWNRRMSATPETQTGGAFDGTPLALPPPAPFRSHRLLFLEFKELPFVPRERLMKHQQYFQRVHRHTYLKGRFDKRGACCESSQTVSPREKRGFLAQPKII
ncbi:Cytochrome c oxidase subunit VIIa [Musa troglodytarum]|uniref:Cytochrome c oxidase subunit VIIa n=1 Tax=Musa troglodytarum TaxID=320322 RepID=A0A9E7K9J4_9LILI|nr:Cytochrome c oxidase subunit VIIa [Musa troglodytarum]